MRRIFRVVTVVLALSSCALGGDPLQGANFAAHISGPTLSAGELEGKVVFLEYFGYR